MWFLYLKKALRSTSTAPRSPIWINMPGRGIRKWRENAVQGCLMDSALHSSETSTSNMLEHFAGSGEFCDFSCVFWQFYTFYFKFLSEAFFTVLCLAYCFTTEEQTGAQGAKRQRDRTWYFQLTGGSGQTQSDLDSWRWKYNKINFLFLFTYVVF